MYIKHELQLCDVIRLKVEVEIPRYFKERFKYFSTYWVTGIANDHVLIETNGGTLLKLTQRQINKYFELVRVG